MGQRINPTDQYNGGAPGLVPSVMPKGIKIDVDEEAGLVLFDDGVSLCKWTGPETRGVMGALTGAWSRVSEAGL